MFHIIPYMNYEIKSLNKKEVILERFCNSVNIIQTFLFTKTSSFKDFEGILYNDAFCLRRILKLGYSAFLPILSCKIHEEEKNLRLKVNIQFHKYVNIGLIVFLLFLISVITFDFVSIAIIIVPYFFVVYIFNKEVQLLKEKINEIIQ